MKLQTPSDLLYTRSHEWIRDMGQGKVRIGITDYAQKTLGGIVFVNLPEVGEDIRPGDMLGELESVKTVAELYTPLGGIVTAVNTHLAEAPESINGDPYSAWIAEIACSLTKDKLITAAEYEAYCQDIED